MPAFLESWAALKGGALDIVVGDSLYCLDSTATGSTFKSINQAIKDLLAKSHAAAKQDDATPAEGELSKLLLGCVMLCCVLARAVWVNFGRLKRSLGRSSIGGVGGW